MKIGFAASSSASAQSNFGVPFRPAGCPSILILENFALQPAGRYTRPSEIDRQIRGFAFGAFDIHVALNGMFAAGQHAYGRGARMLPPNGG